jgi:hypothetical protein
MPRLSIAFMLALVAHLLRLRVADADDLALVEQPDLHRDPRRDEDAVLRRFQHVERLLVGEARVVDDVQAVTHRLLDRAGRARVARHPLAADLRLLHRDRHLFVAHPVRRRVRARDQVVARQVELDGVDAVLQEHPHRLAHPFGPVHDHAERHLGERQVWQHVVAERAGDGDLLARGEVARPGDLARVDRIADHAVEARLRRRRADAGGPAVVEVLLRHARRPERVLLVRQLLDGVERLRVRPAEVRVRLAHARHQRRAGAVDHGDPGDRQGPRAAPDALDPVALDQDLAGVGLGAGTVDDADVGEQNVGHASLLCHLRWVS